MTPQEIFDEIMKFFFTLQILNKIYHLTTTLYARHKATDVFDDNLQNHIDKFAEVYIGRYNVRINITKLNFNPEYLSDGGIERLFLDSISYLENLDRLVNNTELLNIRDEILADINKTLYLFRLK